MGLWKSEITEDVVEQTALKKNPNGNTISYEQENKYDLFFSAFSIFNKICL